MIDKELLEQWRDDKLITAKQLPKLQADLDRRSQEKSSGRLVLLLSVLGAAFVGIAAIIFIGTNWDVLSGLAKTLLLACFTLLSFGAGYLLRERFAVLPRVGSALMLLGTLLFGATLFMWVNAYEIDVAIHWIMLIWMVAAFVVTFVHRLYPVAILSLLLLLSWHSALLFNSLRLFGEVLAPFAFLLLGVIVFGAASLLSLSARYDAFVRLYRVAGVVIVLGALTAITFYETTFRMVQSLIGVHPGLYVWIALYGCAALLLSVVNWVRNDSQDPVHARVWFVAVALTCVSVLMVFVPVLPLLYNIVFNVLLATIVAFVLLQGVRQKSLFLINSGVILIAGLVMLKYSDWFFDSLEASTFFFIGGLLLLIGGIYLERTRRELTAAV